MSISLTRAIDRSFINGFVGLATKSAQSNSRAGASSSVSMSDGLRTGARAMSSAVQNLNAVISFVGIAKGKLEGLNQIVDRMIELAERGTKRGSSSAGLDLQFQKLANEFEAIIEDGEVQGIDSLTSEGIKEAFANVGLDPNRAASIASIFEEFVLTEPDDKLASEKTKAKRPIAIPSSAFEGLSTQERSFTEIFDTVRRLSRRPDAYRMLADVKELKKQIESNISVLDQGITVVGKNLELVRATGLAFLDVANKLRGTEDAEKVAGLVRDVVRQTAGKYLSETDNLQPVVSIAALGNSTNVTA